MFMSKKTHSHVSMSKKLKIMCSCLKKLTVTCSCSKKLTVMCLCLKTQIMCSCLKNHSHMFVTGCCVSLRDFEELGMQTCIPGLVLLVRIARQHGWLLKPCACIDHTVITLSSHLAVIRTKASHAHIQVTNQAIV